jgi:hypothetical protein
MVPVHAKMVKRFWIDVDHVIFYGKARYGNDPLAKFEVAKLQPH